MLYIFFLIYILYRMIKNSYQIFNCNEINSQFRILRKEDENVVNKINRELRLIIKITNLIFN